MKYRIHKKGDFEAIVQQESGYVGRIATQGELVVSEVLVQKEKEIVILPSASDQDEFYYVLEGSLIDDVGDVLLKSGDSITLDTEAEPVYLIANEETKILYISKSIIMSKTLESMNLLNEMVAALENKDHYTKQHCGRVLEIAPKIAAHMKLTSHELEVLFSAALYHDIGKININEEILLKPEALTYDEYEYIKSHPTFGKELLLEHGLEEVANVIEMHHERIDGSGYPYGLRGDQIRIEAKIIAVIDSYDAMTTDRPYKKGCSRDEALREIESLRGLKYDENVVDVFLKVMKEY